MAPEQNEGQMLFQTDIYSYGVILTSCWPAGVPFPLQDNGETARNAVMIATRNRRCRIWWRSERKICRKLDGRAKASGDANPVLVIKYSIQMPGKKAIRPLRQRHGFAGDHCAQQHIGDLDGNSLMVLKPRTKPLQMQLAQYQEAAAIKNRTTVTVPKPRSGLELSQLVCCWHSPFTRWSMKRKFIIRWRLTIHIYAFYVASVYPARKVIVITKPAVLIPMSPLKKAGDSWESRLQ